MRLLTCLRDGLPSKRRFPEGIRHGDMTKGVTVVLIDANRCSSLGYDQGLYPGSDGCLFVDGAK